MTDIKEAHGLEVVAWLNTSSSAATTYTPTVMDWDDEHEPVESLCRLSDATAVIDQQAAELAYFGEQELHLRSVIDQLREELNKPKMDANISLQLNQQLRERVAELERAITSSLPCSYYMDLPDGDDPSLEEQLRRMAEDAANLRTAELRLHEVATHCATVEQELDALKSATVVMPDRRIQALAGVSLFDLGHAKGWNACLDKFESLNRSKT